jgi:dethiobiotin synthetase
VLKTPASPHYAAQIEGIGINLDDFDLPKTDSHLITEGAGGILVPLNDHSNIIEIASRFDMEIILVSNLYLGSINHTLLSVEYLKSISLNVKGIIFNGPPNRASEEIILDRSGWDCLLKIPQEKEINKAVIEKYANQIDVDELT